MASLDCHPATMLSSGVINLEQFGSTLARTLWVPINDLMRATVSGAGQKARIAMRCGLACKVPDLQIHRRIVVEVGLTTVLEVTLVKGLEDLLPIF